MSLKEQLAEMKAMNIAKHPKESVDLVLGDIERLKASDLVANAPKEREKLKEFELTNQLGAIRSLSQLLKSGPVVVTFYRGGWCPYCNLELRAYQTVLNEIQACGGTLVAITPELPDASLSTFEKNALEFEVLSDANSDYAREIGLVFTLPEKLRTVYASFGIDLEKHNGKGQFDLPLAATFVVDVDGTITFADIDADFTTRTEPTVVVEKLKALMS